MDLRSRIFGVIFACGVVVASHALVGCADGPFNGGGTLNPWLRKEWELDERRGPTFHTQREQLRQLAESVGYQPPERQAQIGQDLLERYRNEANPLLRVAIIQAAANVKSSMADEALAAALNDTDAEVRIAAVKAVGKQGNEESLKLLAEAMSNEADLDVRIAVADELKRYKNSPEATRALAVALDDNDAALQHQAILSLQEVTGRQYGMSAPAWREYLAGGNPTPPPAPSVAERVKGWVWW